MEKAIYGVDPVLLDVVWVGKTGGVEVMVTGITAVEVGVMIVVLGEVGGSGVVVAGVVMTVDDEDKLVGGSEELAVVEEVGNKGVDDVDVE